MDDPMRGVDVGTKLEVYEMIRAEAEARAHLHLVHHRDRRAAAIATAPTCSATAASSPSLAHGDLTEEKVLQASFREGGA